MSDETQNAQQEAQRMAKELGIYEIVRNVASNGKRTTNFCESEWEGCKVKFHEPRKAGGFFSEISNVLDTNLSTAPVTSIVMPDGTILYRVFGDNGTVTDFRYGKWVDRIKAYSEKITLDKQRIAEEKAQKKRDEELKPFSQIDF